ncbi:MAG: Dihydropteroate synthase [Pseudomonadota bacterium]|jgi:dihydropteroate synthase
MRWQTSRFDIDLSTPKIMGIVNLTPDSFSDGGQRGPLHAQLTYAEGLLKDGADLLDLGAESTRPGAVAVPLQEELHRLRPLLQELVRWQVPISVDTYKPEVMQMALDLGADIINDVWALRQPKAQEVIAAHPSCGVCVMHMHGEPLSMQLQPFEGDVWPEVLSFLQQRLHALESLGIQKNRIVIDPGIGFGKTPQQNMALLAQQERILELDTGLLVGWSRKSTLGLWVGDGGSQADPARVAPSRRLASAAAALIAVQRGAHIVRVHEVRDTRDVLRVWQAVA